MAKVSAKSDIDRATSDHEAVVSKAKRVGDSYQNFAQSQGIGTDNTTSGSMYGFNPITRVRVQLEWIHRGTWIGGQAIDCVADDMTREGASLIADLEPDNMEKITHEEARLEIWSSLNDAVKWARLYGGCLAVLMVDGQDPSTPMNIDAVGPGQFRGLCVLDRWMVEPSLNDLVTDLGPEMGNPKFYRVTAQAPGFRMMKIHHSRCIRLEGIRLPYWQRLMENLWGLSVIERLYDRLVAFDAATTGAAQLVHKTHLRTFKVKDFRDIVAEGGPALAALQQQMNMMRFFQTNEGITLMDADDTFEAQTHSAFSGLDDIILQFGQQIAGSLQIPLTRLFGQAPAGMNATGESDMRNYYDGIKQQQVKQLSDGLRKIYVCIAKSLGIELPDNWSFEFNSLYELTDKEKAEASGVLTSAVVSAQSAGIVGRKTALSELRASSKEFGLWSSITDEEIAEAEEDPPALPDIAPTEGPEAEHEAAQNGPAKKVTDWLKRKAQR